MINFDFVYYEIQYHRHHAVVIRSSIRLYHGRFLSCCRFRLHDLPHPDLTLVRILSFESVAKFLLLMLLASPCSLNHKDVVIAVVVVVVIVVETT